MGLFSKDKKKEEKPSAGLPPPPGPPSMDAPLAPEQKPEDLPKTGMLEAPPIPGGSLNDIKSQISTEEEPQAPEPMAMKVEEHKEEDTNLPALSEDDSLFDLSELDMPDFPTEESSSTEMAVAGNTSTFVRNSGLHSHSPDKTYYITTAEFKSLLEIVENVKNKVKDSSERHLRLLDIKAEEDIEYENLKRDFEFIEDKLYQADSLIFEK